MNRISATAAALLCFGILEVTGADQQEGDSFWPSWRGPLESGVAPKANPPTDWSETRNVKWKVKLPGEGSGTPAIWGEKIFVLTAINTGKKPETSKAQTQGVPPSAQVAPAEPSEGRSDQNSPGGPGRPRRGGNRGGMGGEKPTELHQFAVLCLDRGTGKTLWQQTAQEIVPHQVHHQSDGSFAPSSPVTDGEHLFAYFGSRGLYSYDMNGKLEWSQDFGDMNMKLGFGKAAHPHSMGIPS